MIRRFDRQIEGINKTFRFINLPENSLMKENWEGIASQIRGNEPLMAWLSRLNSEDCRSFSNIFVLDPFFNIYQENREAYLECFDKMAGATLNYYQKQGVHEGAKLMHENRGTAPILGVQSYNVILIDFEKIIELKPSIGSAVAVNVILHECTHLIETYIADGDCILGRLDPESAANCEKELFFYPEQIFELCPDIGSDTRGYVEYLSAYQKAEGQQREVLTSAVEMLTAAILDMRDPSSEHGLKNAEDLLSEHLERGLAIAMAQPAGQVNAAVTKQGIDVSYWNGHLTKEDYTRMRKQGMSFVIARAGGYVVTMEDSTFENNYKQAKAAGMRFGAYYYGSAVTEEEARKEARHAVRLCKGKDLNFPIWYDVEDPSTMGKLSKSQLTNIIKAFCHTVKEEGRRAGVYASYSWLTSKIGDLKGVDVWVAQYNSSCSYGKPKALWQYTSTKTFKGVKGRFDVSMEMK